MESHNSSDVLRCLTRHGAQIKSVAAKILNGSWARAAEHWESAGAGSPEYRRAVTASGAKHPRCGVSGVAFEVWRLAAACQVWLLRTEFSELANSGLGRRIVYRREQDCPGKVRVCDHRERRKAPPLRRVRCGF